MRHLESGVLSKRSSIVSILYALFGIVVQVLCSDALCLQLLFEAVKVGLIGISVALLSAIQPRLEVDGRPHDAVLALVGQRGPDGKDQIPPPRNLGQFERLSACFGVRKVALSIVALIRLPGMIVLGSWTTNQFRVKI